MTTALIFGLAASTALVIGTVIGSTWASPRQVTGALLAFALGVDVSLSIGTAVTAGFLGVVVVALAPLLTARRLRRMDVPATLRVME